MSAFRDKFGLDYLKQFETTESKQEAPEKGRRSGDESQMAPGMADALIAYGRPMIETLSKLPGQSGRTFDLLDRLNVRIDVLIPVVNYLISKGYVTKIEEDKKGNDLLKVTELGQRLLG